MYRTVTVLGLWFPLPEATSVALGGAEVLKEPDAAHVTPVVAVWQATVTRLAGGLLQPVKFPLAARTHSLNAAGLLVVLN